MGSRFWDCHPKHEQIIFLTNMTPENTGMPRFCIDCRPEPYGNGPTGQKVKHKYVFAFLIEESVEIQKSAFGLLDPGPGARVHHWPRR